MKFMTLSVFSRLKLFSGATFELRSLPDGMKFLRPPIGVDHHGLLVSNDLLLYGGTLVIPKTFGGRSVVEVTLSAASIVNFYGARMAIPPVNTPYTHKDSFLVWIPSERAQVTKINGDFPNYSNGMMMHGLYMLKPKQQMSVHVTDQSAADFDLTVTHNGTELLVDGRAMDSTVIFE